MLSRRRFLGALAGGTVGAGVLSLVAGRPFSGTVPAGDLFAGPGPTVNLRDMGARGDGRTDDTSAFQRAAAALQAAGGGTAVVPPGRYVVGRQRLAGRHGAGHAYRPEPVFLLHGCPRPVVVEGEGAVLQAAPGLRFGAFDPQRGHPVDDGGVDYDLRADAYWGMLAFTQNAHVTVRGIELDGNDAGLVLGGTWGDAGRQCAASGLAAVGNGALVVQDVRSHHHGLDGITLSFPGLTAGDPARPVVLERVACDHNARQGLTWVGGIGLTARQCRFNHTGRGRFASSPGAGVDIEAEESVCRDGRFVDCEFVDNAGPGMVADGGDGGYSAFERCRFHGTTYWSAWPRRPALRFDDCTFLGSVPQPFGSPDPALATRFVRCRFADPPEAPGGVFRSTALLEVDGDNVLFDGCRVDAHLTRGLYVDGGGSREVLRATTVVHRHAGLPPGDFQSLVRGARLEDVHFEEAFPPGAAGGWYVVAEGVQITGAVRVDGPNVRWGAPGGPVGRIAGG